MSTSHLKDHMPHHATFHSFSEFRAANLPAEDQTVLGSLSSSEIPAWTVARVEDYKQRISELEAYVATLQSLHNACAPISSLPNEVLMKVFGEFSLDDPSIRRVCRRWRRVVLATPSFWVRCLASRCFGENVNDQALFYAALKFSGTRPLSLHLRSAEPPTWRMFVDHRGRIARLSLSEYLDSNLSSSVKEFFRSGPIDSLRVLRLKSTFLTVRELAAVLDNCPLLEDLRLDTYTLSKAPVVDSNVIEHAICFPRLRELTINESPFYVVRMLRLFKELHAQTTLRLFLSHSGRDVTRQVFVFDGAFKSSPIDRMCIEPFGDFMVAKGYAGLDERLRMSANPWDFTRSIKWFSPPASVLTLNPLEGNGDWTCEELTFEWDLPYLRRLEITHTAPSVTKATSVTGFLDRHGSRAGELSVAWTLPIVPGQEERPCAVAELQQLADVLENHVDNGNPRLGSLELYAIERHQEWMPFMGSIGAGSNAHLCSQLVEPLLSRLRELVIEVHIG